MSYIYKVIGSRGSTFYSISVGSNTFHDLVTRSEVLTLISKYKYRKHSIGIFTVVDGVVIFIDKRSFLGVDFQLSLDL